MFQFVLDTCWRANAPVLTTQLSVMRETSRRRPQTDSWPLILVQRQPRMVDFGMGRSWSANQRRPHSAKENVEDFLVKDTRNVQRAVLCRRHSSKGSQSRPRHSHGRGHVGQAAALTRELEGRSEHLPHAAAAAAASLGRR